MVVDVFSAHSVHVNIKVCFKEKNTDPLCEYPNILTSVYVGEFQFLLT